MLVVGLLQTNTWTVLQKTSTVEELEQKRQEGVKLSQRKAIMVACVVIVPKG